MRYQKRTIITTNLDYPDWYSVFKKKSLVDVMLDRFKHFVQQFILTALVCVTGVLKPLKDGGYTL